MIKALTIKNLGSITEFNIPKAGKINLIIGKNGCGKSFLIKALYASVKAIEQNGRGKERRNINELLEDKLYWTFQPKHLGDIVRKSSGNLSLSISSDKGEELQYKFGASTSKHIHDVSSSFRSRTANSIFLPAKEVLSIQELIKESRSDKFNAFGFDDTYYDLANALTPTTKGKNYEEFSNARKKLEGAINGRIFFDETKKEWIFKDGGRKEYSIELTSEGIKKISILDALLGNHYLSNKSIIFIDEPESALHPELISTFMDIIHLLSKLGVQFFIATHSYFVIKKLYILAHKEKVSTPVFSFEDDKWVVSDLKTEMPKNPIIGQSINLYKEEIEL